MRALSSTHIKLLALDALLRRLLPTLNTKTRHGVLLVSLVQVEGTQDASDRGVLHFLIEVGIVFAAYVITP
eukprot:1160665-Pelagomonas_calceolata.AAC.4